MGNNTTAFIDVQFDMGDANEQLSTMRTAMDGLGKIANRFSIALVDAFSPISICIEGIKDEVVSLGDSIETSVKQLAEVKSADNPATKSASLFDSISGAYDAVLQGVKKIEEIEKNSGKLINPFEEIVTSPNISALVEGLLPKTSELAGTVGDWAQNIFGKSLAENISKLGTQIGGAASGILTSITNVFSSIGSALGGMSIGWGLVIAAVIGLVALIIQNWDSIKAVLITVAEWVNTNVIQPVVGFCTGLWTGIVNIATGIWDTLAAVFAPIAQWVYDNVILPVMNFFAPLVEWHYALFGSIWETISSVFHNIGVIASGCWEIIQAAWGIAAEWFYTTLIQPVQQFFSDMWNGVKSGAFEAWQGIQSIFSTAANFFGDIFSDGWQKVVSVFSVAGNIFVNIRDGILTAFKSIVNGIIGGLNEVITIPFNGINAALSLIRGINIFGLTPFSGLGKISVPRIPYLAQGAVLPANRPFLAVVGDQKSGTNVEAPLATIQEALANVLARQGAGDITITFAGDLAQLGRVLKPVIDRENRRVGGNLARGAV